MRRKSVLRTVFAAPVFAPPLFTSPACAPPTFASMRCNSYTQTRLPTMDFEVDGQRVTAIIDSGATASLIDHERVARHKHISPLPLVAVHGKTCMSVVGTVPIAVDDITIEFVVVRESAFYCRAWEKCDALLGVDALRRSPAVRAKLLAYLDESTGDDGSLPGVSPTEHTTHWFSAAALFLSGMVLPAALMTLCHLPLIPT